jgi:hypothetical protein
MASSASSSEDSAYNVDGPMAVDLDGDGIADAVLQPGQKLVVVKTSGPRGSKNGNPVVVMLAGLLFLGAIAGALFLLC